MEIVYDIPGSNAMMSDEIQGLKAMIQVRKFCFEFLGIVLSYSFGFVTRSRPQSHVVL